MLNKTFFETYPLYRKFLLELAYHSDSITDIDTPAINMPCRKCELVQTFNRNNELWEVHAVNQASANNKDVWDTTIRVRYVCSACDDYEYLFYINFVKTGQSKKDENNNVGYVWKVGQVPAWEINVDKNLSDALGEKIDLYKRGLTCESQGYGIGAFAYYRRVVEEVINDLLKLIEELLEGEDKKKYHEAYLKTVSAKNTENKIELVQDLLPITLRPEGFNPLAAIHSSLSEGLHSQTDDRCLELASTIREVLEYLINQVIKNKQDSTKFTDSMKKLLGKK